MARLRGFEKLTDVDDALTIFYRSLKPKVLTSESILTQNALGRITAENIAAPIDLPQFNRSAVDGYAVKAEDTTEASQSRPRMLKLTVKDNIGRGEAKRIWTGNPTPRNADAAVMLEHTRAKDNTIEIIAPLTPGENVSKEGEDVKKGEMAVKAGTRLQPHHLALLAALGLTKVDVVRKPRIAILSTGNELIELGTKTSSSQIVNSNRYLIAGLCHELGADPMYMGIVRDNENEIASRIGEGLEKADIIITTGGTSVGIADLVPLVVDKLGRPGIVVHGIALRPGMPTALGVLKSKPVFVLSGNPVAAAVGFEVFARPTVLKMLGTEAEPRPWVQAKLTRRVAGALGRRIYLRVKTEWRKAELAAEPVSTRGSGLLSSLTKANGYVIIPEDREGLEKGESVIVHLFSPIYTEEK